MKNALILTIIGPDHPGIVDDLSAAINENGGNWLESRFTNLAGQFAGVLLVECPPGKCDEMRAALETLESGGLEIQVAVGSPNSLDASREQIKLEISGPDHPGIIQDISHFLAERSINIIEMQSHVEEGAMSGGYIFHSTILSSIPAEQLSSEVENALDDLASTLNIDITLDDLKGTRTRI